MITDFERYLKLRNIEGISKEWQSYCSRWLKQYLDFVDWMIDEDKTLEYCNLLKEKYSITTYRKRVYQITRFLKYLGVEWTKSIKLPSEPTPTLRRLTVDDIKQVLSYFKNHPYRQQIEAIVLLGATSGLRAQELYQLKTEDLDIENRIVYVRHNPVSKQTTKTKRSRVSFFNSETQKTLSEYLVYFENSKNLKQLFSQTHILRIFKKAPLQIKDLRKFFSQEWDRLGGPTSIKKILMGHSLRGDVDLMHYNAQSPEDLKRIYDRVGIKIF